MEIIGFLCCFQLPSGGSRGRVGVRRDHSVRRLVRWSFAFGLNGKIALESGRLMNHLEAAAAGRKEGDGFLLWCCHDNDPCYSSWTSTSAW